MSTPQIRSRELLTQEGYLVATVESKKRFPPKDPAKRVPCRTCGHQQLIEISIDLLGFADILAIHPQKREFVLVQATSAANHATRRNKILASFEAKLVLLAGARILVHSWRKDERLNRWTIREEEITLKDFQQAPHYPSTVAQLMEIRRRAKKPDLPPGATLEFSPILDAEIPF
jgi:hypothetical protein